MFPTVAASLG